MALAPCFHSLCPGCGGAGAPGALDDMFQTCQAAALTGSDIALRKAMLTSVKAKGR
ncbi:uncharacterized protein BO88DRAFT_458498 [Aspergillus vadensis CBS 113365]|uniref:Uncharacterized protein n=1 Tax=Aspergillus vadensis (strain CBS 113365 / IMI 142717 / IBT 24658) TaxID=1448311 RepID=A0A319BL13_ASPVC|nr:hypothetical protein BO88DRAFT_458498 [Aspergillus vadensis CBS 113365]PYH63998.1 hypothetical protein BO88DRAFT_458498 [Aspergillus vadensis CBS 113365]